MGASWSRVANSTIAKYIKGAENNVLRNRKIPAMLKKRGRITFNWSGDYMDWKVRFRRSHLRTLQTGDTLDFPASDRYRTGQLGWAGYATTDSMTKGDYLKNRSTEAIINLYSNLASELMEDAEEDFAQEFYVDATLPENDGRISGINSFGQFTRNAGNGAGSPTGQFAGLSCVPGAISGTWDGGAVYGAKANNGWPNGRGDADFDFWSPICVDYTDGTFAGFDGSDWESNCIEAISLAKLKGQKSASPKGQLDLFLIDDDMYRILLKNLRGKERIIVGDGEMKQLGFNDTVSLDGIDVTSEYGMPPGTGYGLNFDQMELRSMQGQLFVPEGPDPDIAAKAWRFSIDMFGQMVWNPKWQLFLKDLSS